MSTYTHEDFKVILDLLKDFNDKSGLKTDGITFTVLNQKVFDYPNLMTWLEKDRNLIANNPNDPDIRQGKKGYYKKWNIHDIVFKLMEIFEIDIAVIKNKGVGFEIDPVVAKIFKDLYEIEKKSEQLIYLIGSTYQGKQLKVKPRSIFEINLKKKTKNVTFYYYGTNSKEPIQTTVGTLTGKDLIYLTFDTGNSKKMYILKKGDLEWDKVTYIKGSYIGDDDKDPMAGSIICEKIPDLESAENKLHKLLPPGIQYQLLYTQFKEKGKVITQEKPMSNNHFMVAAKRLKENLKGFYYGIYLSTESAHSLLTSKLELREDGTVAFYGKHNENNENGEEGWIYFSEDLKKIYLRFKYNARLNIFKYFITLTSTHTGKNYWCGSYGGGSNFPDIPETGRIIFIKIDDKVVERIPVERINIRDENQLKKFLNTPKIGSFPYDATQFLLGKKISQKDNNFSDTPSTVFAGTSLDELNKTPDGSILFGKHEDFPVSKQFIGIYRAYVIQYFEDSPNFRIQKVAIEFLENQNVVALARTRTRTLRKYYGRVSKYNRIDKLFFNLAFQDANPELHHTLECITQNAQEVIFRGTYTGTGQMAQNHPVGGRILLSMDKTASSIDQVQTRDFDLSDSNEIQLLESEQPGLLNYFLGLKDNMVESYGLFKNSDFLPISNTPHEEINGQVSGYYLSFRILTNLKTISIVPLEIDNFGNVKMKSTRKLTPTQNREYSGICDINDKILSIQFNSYGGKPLYAHSKFNKSIDIVDENDNNILMGIFSSSNSRESRAFTCIQVLIFQNKILSSYEEFDPITIDIPFYSQQPCDEYNKWNSEYNGILDYLIGDEYNMIRMSQGPKMESVEKRNIFKKKINYGEIFYLAGLNYFEKDDIKAAKDSWFQAILNGFRDLSLINELKSKNKNAWTIFNEIAKKFNKT